VKPRRPLALAATAPLSLLLLGTADTPLSAGLWEVRNSPGVATLDGRTLSELPIGPIRTQKICLSPAELAKPVAFLIRDLGQDCVVANAKLAGGRVKVAGSCPNQLEGPDGAFELNGRLASGRYDVAFKTTAFGDNGRMTFSGKMTGRRLGRCPAG